MNRQSQTLHENQHFRLSKRRHRKSDKIFYQITLLDSWDIDVERARDIIDPLRQKSGKFGRHWKYRNLNDAEKMYTALAMSF